MKKTVEKSAFFKTMQKFQHSVFGENYAAIHMDEPEEKEMPRMYLDAPMEARTQDTSLMKST